MSDLARLRPAEKTVRAEIERQNDEAETRHHRRPGAGEHGDERFGEAEQ